MKEMIKGLRYAILNMFDNTNVTTDADLSDEMKTYYSDYLIDNAEPKLVHDQFGQKQPIPKNGGKTIEFRKYDSLDKALTPLTEGVTPSGKKLKVSVITATVDQYGDYIELSDVLQLTAIDNNLVQATKLLGSQAGRTLDTITREVLNGGTNVQYAAGEVSDRSGLIGGQASGNHYLTVDAIKKAVRFLKVMNAEPVEGNDFVAIIHPDCEYDITNDPDWKDPHKYVDTENMYNGEIGKIAGVRFVETTEAKVFHAPDLTSADRTLAVNGAVSASTAVVFDGNTVAVAAHELKGRILQFYDATNGWQIGEVADNTASTGTSTITLKAALTIANDAVIYPGEAGRGGRDVYSTLIIADNAYGVTEVEGGGLQHIVKGLGSAGAADPLNQRATVGWKAIKTAERLVEQFMVRIETCSTFAVGAN